MAEGERMREEAAAYHTAHIRGRGRWKTMQCMNHAVLVIFVMVLASTWNMVIPVMDYGINM